MKQKRTLIKLKKFLTNEQGVLKFIFCVSILVLTLIACNGTDSTENYQPTYSVDTIKKKALLFGFPSFSYSETAEPLIKYLNAGLPGVEIKMKACVSYEEYIEQLNNHVFDITVINGFKALEASDNGYSIVGKIADDEAYSGVVFVRKDADIKTIKDLKGKKIALVSSNVLPGTMMPLYYLQENGLDVNRDITIVNTSSFESAIIATYVGKAEAGLCLTRSWNVYVKGHPEVLSKLDLKWESPPLIHNGLLIKNTVDDLTSNRLENIFFSLDETAEGREILSKLDISNFEKASPETYAPMLEFKKKFDAVINIKTGN